MSERPDDDLEERIDDLERALRELRDELRESAPRGPLGLPRPPSPDEVLRFADEAAIPAMIAILEANIRVLEGMRRAIRLSQANERTRERASDVTGDATRFGREALERLDAAIADLERVVAGTPDDVAGADVLDEANRLREDLDSRISTARDSVEQQREMEKEDRSTPTTIDIDEEIESIKKAQGKDGAEDDEDETDG